VLRSFACASAGKENTGGWRGRDRDRDRDRLRTRLRVEMLTKPVPLAYAAKEENWWRFDNDKAELFKLITNPPKKTAERRCRGGRPMLCTNLLSAFRSTLQYCIP